MSNSPHFHSTVLKNDSFAQYLFYYYCRISRVVLINKYCMNTDVVRIVDATVIFLFTCIEFMFI